MAEREVEEQRLALAILGHERDARTRRAEDAAAGQARLADEHLAAVGRVQSEDRLEQLRSAGADETEDAEDLAAVRRPGSRRRRPAPGSGRGRAAPARWPPVPSASLARAESRPTMARTMDSGVAVAVRRSGFGARGSRFAVRGSLTCRRPALRARSCSNVPAYCPSRSTVMRSHERKTSGSRCDT